MLDLSQLQAYQHKPDPFTPGEALFWDDPHISEQMLSVHLDPDTDLASRKFDTIDASVAWIIHTLGLTNGDYVLDLGCGPGLYAYRMAQHGLAVTGVDISANSIAYARDFATKHARAVNYLCQNYLTLSMENQFEAALLIYGDYCTFKPGDRRQLLANVHRSLHPGGYFVLDVTTRVLRSRHGLKNGWNASAGGFWRPGPHLVLEQGFDFPDEDIWLDQYIVVEESGAMGVYRNWFQDFNRESITAELAAGGFKVIHVGGDLCGAPFAEDSEWIGIVAARMGA